MSKSPRSFNNASTSADRFLLSQIDWQFIGSLTFRQERLPERIRISMFFSMLRKLARREHLFFPRLIWLLRLEASPSGRLHFHFLLTGLTERAISTFTCNYLQKEWEKNGGGMARVAIFDPALDGVDYVVKPDGPFSGCESYKFRGPSRLMPSRRLLEKLKSRLKRRVHPAH
jgi:hypothetical protein